MSNFDKADDEIKHGRYANVTIYILIAALLSVSSFLVYIIKTKDNTIDRLHSQTAARDDQRDARCDSVVTRLTTDFRAEIKDLREEFKEYREETRQDRLSDNARSESLTTAGRRAARSFKVESDKVKKGIKEIDSVTENLLK